MGEIQCIANGLNTQGASLLDRLRRVTTGHGFVPESLPLEVPCIRMGIEAKKGGGSMKSVAEVLSDSKRALLKIIRETEPQSVAELSKATGRQRSNLSLTLTTMSPYGLVDLRREKENVRLIARCSAVQIQTLA